MLDIIKDILNKDDNVVFGYLFGSYAKGNESERSDIDIAVYLKDTEFDKILTLHHNLQKVLKKEVDMVILNSAKNIYLLESIIKDGIRVKESSTQDIFEVDTNLAILDFKAFREYIDGL